MTDLEPRQKVPNRVVRMRPTPAIRRKLIEQMQSGVTPDTAADAIGITWLVLQRWLERGLDALREDDIDRDDLPFVQLVIDIRQAIALFEVDALDRWNKHGDTEWQALRDLLERTRQEKYARPVRHTIGNADGQPFRIEIDGLERASLKALREVEESLARLQQADDIIDVEAIEITDGT